MNMEGRKEGSKMKKEIWLDMDGTIADLYGVDNWLEYLKAEDEKPYKIAKPLVNMKNLAKELNRLQQQGWTIGIITWLAKNGKPEYNDRVARVKLNWLEEHLNGFQFDIVHIVEYGTPKQELGRGILFDDEIQNRINWKDKAYDERNILETLGAIA
jgi:hypothetical protein